MKDMKEYADYKDFHPSNWPDTSAVLARTIEAIKREFPAMPSSADLDSVAAEEDCRARTLCQEDLGRVQSSFKSQKSGQFVCGE